MWKKIAGYILMCIGFLGVCYFYRYKSGFISYPTLWFVLSFVIAVAGYFLSEIKLPFKKSRTQKKFDDKRLDRLKLQGQKVILTGDNCEIKETDFYGEVVVRKIGYSEEISASHPTGKYYEDEEQQSFIIYYHTIGKVKHRLSSNVLPLSGDSLIKYIRQRRIAVYINRQNPNDYEFEIRE